MVDEHPIPYPFRSGAELLRMCEESGRAVADVVRENEKCWRSTYDIRAGLLAVAGAMDAAIEPGVIPAVLRYYRESVPGASEEGVVDFLLTATAIGIAYGEKASLSDIEGGSEGEAGTACAMAAAAIAAVLGGSNEQIRNAVEIASADNRGIAGEPVQGIAQIACMERNALGAVKAIEAARMALDWMSSGVDEDQDRRISR